MALLLAAWEESEAGFSLASAEALSVVVTQAPDLQEQLSAKWVV